MNKHYRVPNADPGDIASHRCACGENFKSYVEVGNHINIKLPADMTTITPPKFVEMTDDNFPTGGFGDPVIINDAYEVKHTWLNWEDGDHSPYICKCGMEFHTHDLLMEHTALLNPSISTFDMGVAGVAVEREAHKKTLKNLEKALCLIESVRMDEYVTFPWHDEATAFLKEMGRDLDD